MDSGQQQQQKHGVIERLPPRSPFLTSQPGVHSSNRSASSHRSLVGTSQLMGGSPYVVMAQVGLSISFDNASFSFFYTCSLGSTMPCVASHTRCFLACSRTLSRLRR